MTAASNYREFLLVNSTISGVLNTPALYVISAADNGDAHQVTLTSWLASLLMGTLPGSVGGIGSC